MQLPLYERLARQESDFRSSSLASQMLKFRVDNVAEWYLNHMLTVKSEDINAEYHASVPTESFMKSLPNIAPIAPLMWIEYDPNLIVLPEPLKAGEFTNTTVSCGCVIAGGPCRNARAIGFGAKWTLTMQAHRWYKADNNTEYNDKRTHFYVGEDGTPIASATEIKTVDYDGTERQVVDEECFVALATICFLHCKNIRTEDHAPSRQVRRAAERSGATPIVFKTLTLDLGEQTTGRRSQAANEGTPPTKALHIVRGHFAHYTANAPLFGKHVGTYYHPMHRRGSAALGRVEKDYKTVGTPRAVAPVVNAPRPTRTPKMSPGGIALP